MSHAGPVVIVNGYGCHLVPEFTRYLDRVVRFVNEKHPALIILSGGRTQQKSAPGTSEAALMAIYIRERLSHVPEFIIEDDSYTTYDNIQRATCAFRKILPRRPELIYAEIIIFCEATRALKVAMLARHFIGFPPAQGGPPIRIETDSWELMHPFWEMVATFQTWLAIRFPVLNSLFRWWRRRKARTR